jgi:peptide/nickel transport system permease protein
VSQILKRIGLSAVTVFGSVTLVFLLVHLIPGDPVDNLLGEQALAVDKDRMRGALNLDKPLYSQYALFLGDIAGGTLGYSFFRRGETVASMIGERFPKTVILSVLAMALAVCIAIPMGVASARRKGTAIDGAAMALAMIGAALPVFFLGPLLLLVFCKWLGWLPPPAAGDSARSIILPVVTLGFGMAAILSRLTRASMIEALSQDYIVTARAKGLPERTVVFKHALRNALIPVISVMGLQFGAVLSGAIITERVFAWPGMGTLLIEAIEKRDFPVVQGCILVVSICYVAVNLATDLVCAAVDPRMRHGGAR